MLAVSFHVELLMLVDALILPVRVTAAFLRDPPSERRQVSLIARHLKYLVGSLVTERSYPVHHQALLGFSKHSIIRVGVFVPLD
jgi:hypothetical protein